jgi:hypothetical protein
MSEETKSAVSYIKALEGTRLIKILHFEYIKPQPRVLNLVQIKSIFNHIFTSPRGKLLKSSYASLNLIIQAKKTP